MAGKRISRSKILSVTNITSTTAWYVGHGAATVTPTPDPVENFFISPEFRPREIEFLFQTSGISGGVIELKTSVNGVYHDTKVSETINGTLSLRARSHPIEEAAITYIIRVARSAGTVLSLDVWWCGTEWD